LTFRSHSINEVHFTNLLYGILFRHELITVKKFE